jgi:hypothetical protein
LGIGDWAQSPIPNPQSPIPNPQSPIPHGFCINYFKKFIDFSKKIIYIYNLANKYLNK